MSEAQMSRLDLRPAKKLAPFREAQFYWMKFASEVARLRTYPEAVNYVQTRPQLNHIYGHYHRNLSILVYTGSVPEDISREERDLYIELVRRWKELSPEMFMPDVLPSLERALLQRAELVGVPDR